jgi:hypothetical protein|nr:MAG TPA: hypothetical protein [Caudoviricetes sp.]
MDELMQKITEKLNLTIDKAPEVYEMLKWQYVVYDTVNYIHCSLYILLFIAGFGAVFFIMYILDFTNEKISKRIILLSFTPFIVIILLIIILYVYRNINAPDVLFLKEVLRL